MTEEVIHLEVWAFRDPSYISDHSRGRVFRSSIFYAAGAAGDVWAVAAYAGS